MARYRLKRGTEVSRRVDRRVSVDSFSVGREAGAGSVVGKLGLHAVRHDQFVSSIMREAGSLGTHSSCLARPSSVK